MNPRSLRLSLGLSQSQLARLLGTHAMTVSKWERGISSPGEHHRALLSAFAQAAERGARFTDSGTARDPVRFLADLLEAAYRRPELDLGALSATNRFPGRVVQLTRGDVMSKLVIEVAPEVRIGSVITTDSVDRLGLAVGGSAVAIIKATEVLVGKP
jgi:molybdopterin-binding protein